MKLKKVHVTWIDSAAAARQWIDKEELMTVAVCSSVGFLLERTRRHILIAQSYSDTQYGQVLVIPAGCIRKVKRLR